MITLEQEITDKDLTEAISLKCANCYGALSFANALGGYQNVPWQLCHKYPLKDLLEEVEQRKIDLTNINAAVEVMPVKETMRYKRAKGLITEAEFNELFKKWQRGES